MSQVIYESEKTQTKKVRYTGTDTLRVGYNLCYDADHAGAVATEGKTGDATVFNQLRAVRVEKPAVGNLQHYAGVVTENFDSVTGPAWVEIYVPTYRGQKVRIWTEENCTIDTTVLTLKAGSYAAGGQEEGHVIGKALQTINRSSTNGTAQAILYGTEQVNDEVFTASSRTAVQLPTAAIWRNFPLSEMRQNPFLGTLLEVDFRRLGEFPTRTFADTTATILPTANLVGELAVLTSADNEEGAAQWDIPIKVSGGQPWALEARVKIENITDARGTAVIGLGFPKTLAGDVVADDGAALTDGDFLGFVRFAADGDIFDFIYDEGGQTTNVHDADYVTAEADVYFTIGLYFNGTTIQGYIDGVATGTAISAVDIAAADFPTAAICVPTVANKGDNAADISFTMDWIRVAQL